MEIIRIQLKETSISLCGEGMELVVVESEGKLLLWGNKYIGNFCRVVTSSDSRILSQMEIGAFVGIYFSIIEIFISRRFQCSQRIKIAIPDQAIGFCYTPEIYQQLNKLSRESDHTFGASETIFRTFNYR